MQPASTLNPYREPASRPRIFGIGSIALAGLIGGPLASAFLVTRNTKALALQRQAHLAIGFFALATAVWVYALYHVPPDFISQFTPHIPQVFVWWLFSLLLLRRHNADHRASGGSFRSAWSAAGIALLISIAVRVVSFLVGYVSP
jgi:hypothetical protein